MRQVYKGNVSIPLHIVEAFLDIQANGKASPEEQAMAANRLIASLKMGRDNIRNGLDQSNLSVCIGKLGYINARDAQRFLSDEIPRLTIHRNGKDSHSMPLYFKHKPSEYLRRLAQKKKKGKSREKAPSKRR